jgi:hypothetical protein
MTLINVVNSLRCALLVRLDGSTKDGKKFEDNAARPLFSGTMVSISP